MEKCYSCATLLGRSERFCPGCGWPAVETGIGDLCPLVVLLHVKPGWRAGETGLCDIALANRLSVSLYDVRLRFQSHLLPNTPHLDFEELPPGLCRNFFTPLEVQPRIGGEYRVEIIADFNSTLGRKEQYVGEVRVAISSGGVQNQAIHVELNAEKILGVDMSNMIHQSGTAPERMGPDAWIDVPLLASHAATPPVPAYRACLKSETSAHSIFLFAGNRLAFGMAKKERYPEVDLTLRLLPVRSQELDPANWAKSAMISKLHGRLRVVAGSLQIKDESRNGIYLRLNASEGGLASLGELGDWIGTLDEDASLASATRLAKGEWRTLPDHATLTLGKNILHLHLDVCRSQTDGLIDTVHIRRLGNSPTHEYLLVVRSWHLGKVCGPDLADLPGAFSTSIWPDGVQWWANVTNGQASVLQPGAALLFSSIRWTFGEATDEDFVTL